MNNLGIFAQVWYIWSDGSSLFKIPGLHIDFHSVWEASSHLLQGSDEEERGIRNLQIER